MDRRRYDLRLGEAVGCGKPIINGKTGSGARCCPIDSGGILCDVRKPYRIDRDGAARIGVRLHGKGPGIVRARHKVAPAEVFYAGTDSVIQIDRIDLRIGQHIQRKIHVSRIGLKSGAPVAAAGAIVKVAAVTFVTGC